MTKNKRILIESVLETAVLTAVATYVWIRIFGKKRIKI